MFVRKFTKKCSKCGGQLEKHKGNQGTWYLRSKEPAFDIYNFTERIIGEDIRLYFDMIKFKRRTYFYIVHSCFSYFFYKSFKCSAGTKKLCIQNVRFLDLFRHISNLQMYKHCDYTCKKCGKTISLLEYENNIKNDKGHIKW